MKSTLQKTAMICIATAQSAANILPIMTRKPDHVVIVQSAKMICQAKRLKHWLENFGGYSSEQIKTYEGLPDSDVNSLSEYALNLRGDLENNLPDYRLILNATGGNKLMTLAFVDVFRDVSIEIIYTDTENDTLEVIEPKKRQPESVPSIFTIESYLASQGYIARKADSEDEDWCANARRRKSLTKWLADHIDRMIKNDGSGLLPQINRLIHREVLDINGGLKSPKDYQELSYVSRRDHELLKRLSEESILSWTAGDEKKIQFTSQSQPGTWGGAGWKSMFGTSPGTRELSAWQQGWISWLNNNGRMMFAMSWTWLLCIITDYCWWNAKRARFRKNNGTLRLSTNWIAWPAMREVCSVNVCWSVRYLWIMKGKMVRKSKSAPELEATILMYCNIRN